MVFQAVSRVESAMIIALQMSLPGEQHATLLLPQLAGFALAAKSPSVVVELA